MAHVSCPACGDAWHMDLDESGMPYTCYACCNGSIAWDEESVRAYLAEYSGDEREAGFVGPLIPAPAPAPAASYDFDDIPF